MSFEVKPYNIGPKFIFLILTVKADNAFKVNDGMFSNFVLYPARAGLEPEPNSAPEISKPLKADQKRPCKRVTKTDLKSEKKVKRDDQKIQVFILGRISSSLL